MGETWERIQQDAAAFDGLASGAGVGTTLQPPPPPPPHIDTAKELEMLIGPLFGILCPNWHVSAQEVEMLADSYAGVVDKYFPGGMSLGVEVSAAMATLVIFGPRLGTPRKVKKPPAPAPATTPPPPPPRQDTARAAQPVSTKGAA